MSMPFDRAAANIVDDAVTELTVDASAFAQLGAACRVFADELQKEKPNLRRMKDLAEMAAFVAEDRANSADCAREALEAVWADLVKASKSPAAAVSP